MPIPPKTYQHCKVQFYATSEIVSLHELEDAKQNDVEKSELLLIHKDMGLNISLILIDG